MIDRNELAEELMLRENIRHAIGIVKRKNATRRTQEVELRQVIRSLVSEAQAAVAAVAKHENTGINALEDLLRNTNVLSVLETGYKSLTTDKSQRDSYKNHILSAIKNP